MDLMNFASRNGARVEITCAEVYSATGAEDVLVGDRLLRISVGGSQMTVAFTPSDWGKFADLIADTIVRAKH